MPYSGTHTLITLSGRQFGGPETWSFGMRLSGHGNVTQTMVNSAGAAAKTWFTTAASGFHAAQSLDLVKMAPIGPDGKYPPGEDSLESVITGATGQLSGGGPQAPQVALALTLTTALPRGIAHNTRIYLPCPGFGLSGAGGITSANATLIMTQFRTFVLALNGLGTGSVSVMSRKYGAVQPVTGLRCGTVLDTQRRRRRSIPETPSSLAL